MKRIIIDEEDNTIMLSAVNEDTPIFAKRKGVLKGMVVREPDKGWILRTGGRYGATGHHSTLRKCVKSCLEHGFEFFA